jgi:hypothetical protein
MSSPDVEKEALMPARDTASQASSDEEEASVAVVSGGKQADR